MPHIPRIFIAYSRQDLPQLQQLKANLIVLERQNLCSVFYDGVIQAGEHWDKRLKDELHQADIFLLLISTDFLASEYVHEIELPTILKREQEGTAKVFPVILRHCLWKRTPLAQLQTILYKDEPIEVHNAYWHVAELVADAIDQLTGRINHESPIIHLVLPESTINLAEVDPFYKEMVFIKGGSFEMGDVFGEGDDSEKPVHTVQVTDFYFSRFLVTQSQWEKIMGYNPSYFGSDGLLPVETVGWEEIHEFIRVLNKRTGLNYRLPSEAEWEYAARERGNKIRFGNGKNIAVPTEINFNGESKHNAQSYLIQGEYREKTTPLGSFLANDLGLYDLSGNVWEWCADFWHDNYQDAPQSSSAWMEGGDYSRQVVRGGSWDDNAKICRNSSRHWIHLDFRNSYVGFRLARS